MTVYCDYDIKPIVGFALGFATMLTLAYLGKQTGELESLLSPVKVVIWWLLVAFGLFVWYKNREEADVSC